VLKLYGDGPMRDELKQASARLGVADLVSFEGIAPNMDEVYRNAHLLLHTSDYAGMPNVLMEAMASGLPVVADEVGGAGELVKHNQNGFLVAPGAEEDMAQSAAMLIENADLRRRIGGSARLAMESGHAVALLPQVLSQLYARALAR
jgi:glycosyltransferase EpsD